MFPLLSVISNHDDCALSTRGSFGVTSAAICSATNASQYILYKTYFIHDCVIC